MKVQFGKETIEVDASMSTSILELKQLLQSITSCTSIRLIHAGKTLNDDSILIQELPGGVLSKLTMIGSKHSPSDDIIPHFHIKNDLNPNQRRKKAFRYSKSSSAPRHSSEFAFQSISTLPGLPDEARARKILETLANDDIILKVTIMAL